jgi:hypothetical protein
MRERNFFFAASNVSLTTLEPVSRPSAIAAGSTRSTVHRVQADVPPGADGPTPAPARSPQLPARRSTSEASHGDRDLARRQTLTLLTATRHVDVSEAAVLADLLLDPETRTG